MPNGILFWFEHLQCVSFDAYAFSAIGKRQMIHTFTPSNQNVTIGSGGDANETFTGRVERNH